MLEYDDIHVLDRNSEFFGVPTRDLMENAGSGASEEIRSRLELKDKKVSILAGKGNNGGDGAVMARHLAGECMVTLVLAYPEDMGSELHRDNYKKLPDSVKVVVEPDKDELYSILKESDVIVDALLGIGISTEPRDPIKTMIEILEKVVGEGVPGKPFIASLDIPTGIGTPTAVTPHLTITFHAVKRGMTLTNSGEMAIVDIGVPEMARTHVGPGEFVYYPRNKPTSHKGDNGVVMVIGGGPYVGAPVLSSLASLRSGADLVHLFVPDAIFVQASSFSPDIIVHSMGEEYDEYFGVGSVQECIEFSKKCNAVVIGPGLGRHPETWKAVGRFITNIKAPIVVDADALYSLKHRAQILRNKECVITPHLGEFMKLMEVHRPPGDFGEFSELVQRKARYVNTTILLKGRIDIITDGENIRLNETGHPAMTVGGTGDVLTGIVGALLARGMSSFKAARLGAFISGMAGEAAAEVKGFGLMASDVVEGIPEILMKYL